MKWIFLINFAIALAIALLLGFNFFRYHKNRKIREVVNYFSYIGLLYFFVAVFSFLWFLGILKYGSEDFLYLYALVILIQSLFLLMAVYSISNNKKIFYFLFFYLITLLSFFLSIFDFFYLFIITSFLLTLSFFVDLSVKSFHCRKTGYFGIFYSSLSLLFCMLLLFKVGNIFVFSLISNFIFLVLIVNFLRELDNFPYTCEKNEKKRKKSPFFLVFLRHLVFILVMTNFIFIATIAIHEFGHLGTSYFYDCEYGRIVYEKGFPHTEILCSEIPNKYLVILGGVLLPIIIAVFLFIVGGRFIRDIALLIAGFDLIASNGDFFEIGLSGNIVMAALIAGILCLIAGILMLIKSRLGWQYFAS